jgi:hypothetical protein
MCDNYRRRRCQLKKPSMSELKLKNPHFFRTSDAEMTSFLEDKARVLVKEGNGWVLRILTSGDTRPVYRVEDDLTLTFTHHGW